MDSKKHLLLAQVFISMIMAFLMTGIFTFLRLGASLATAKLWALGFVTAWPIAFCLSMIAGPLGFRLAALCLKKPETR